MTTYVARRAEVTEWGSWVGGVVAALVATIGAIWLAGYKAKKDEPYRLLEQYKVMVDTLRVDLGEARKELRDALCEADDLQAKMTVIQSQLADAHTQLASAKALIEHLQTANGFGL